ncbi:Cytochrome b5 [Hibiscus syriacus]|uniref:Cytochrome b5 n=1 Tax=Hibiscus syriacus TaxID=106335 RepID=A0A6A2WVH6_HIBSY|nr:Cytochrome b5 [Hibiscus syriacus]
MELRSYKVEKLEKTCATSAGSVTCSRERHGSGLPIYLLISVPTTHLTHHQLTRQTSEEFIAVLSPLPLPRLSFLTTTMAEHTVFTLQQVAQHKSNNDCWLVIHGKVLNVTKFLEEHPGGEEVLLESAGKDATKEFNDIGHSKTAKNLVFKYQVGVIQGYSSNNNEHFQDLPFIRKTEVGREARSGQGKEKEQKVHLLLSCYFRPRRNRAYHPVKA